jgi:hypothetical protein
MDDMLRNYNDLMLERENNTEQFIRLFKTNLRQSQQSRPELYTWSYDQFNLVFSRFEQAFKNRKGYPKKGLAIEKTCKDLGLKNTYKAINAFLKG